MIKLNAVTKRYPNGVVAVNDLSFEVAEGELCVLIGPSGCGKTTTLKMVNRLIEPSSGEIFINGENVLELNPVELRRRIGYVMQQGGLFPHQRVGENVAVVPRLLGWSKDRIRARVGELLELVGLDPAKYERRFPYELSGGERQRVGVARALGGDPPVLLMDEPFGAVDPITKKRLQDEFLALQLKKTVLFVTHDIEEAVRLANKIAVFRPPGVLEQHATPNEVLARPATPFVADFIGSDRDLQRLEVLAVASGDVTAVPTLHHNDGLGAIANGATNNPGPAGAVLDAHDQLIGWIPAGIATDTSAMTKTAGEVMQRALGPIPVGASLKLALAEILRDDVGYIGITENNAFCGVLTFAALHRAMRRGDTVQTPMA